MHHSQVADELVDRFGRVHRYLRVSVTDRCGFRCRYCMPAEGIQWQPRDQVLSYEEIERLTRMFVSIGVDKVRITGGEPTVRKGLTGLINNLAAIQGIKRIAMTTNGTTLQERAQEYRQAGLGQINISLDSLKPERFAEITRRDCLGQVLGGIEAAVSAGFESVKVNMVVMDGVNDDELGDFVELARSKPVTVRFIEYMPFLGNRWSRAGMVPYSRMRETLDRLYRLQPIEGLHSDVAREFSIEGFAGRVGFVSSMTQSFCSGCDRLRLTSAGALRTCLFGQREVSLRDPMRAGASDQDLIEIVRAELQLKWKEHPPMDELARISGKEMVSIGG